MKGMNYMKKFKVTIEYDGGDFIKIDNGENILKTMNTGSTLADLSVEVCKVISRTIFDMHDSDFGISKDLRVLGYDTFILGDTWAIIDGKVWTVYDVLLAIKNNDYDNLRIVFESPKVMRKNKYTDVIMNLCSLYRRNSIAFFIMTRYIFNKTDVNEFSKTFDKTYYAAAISDNISMFETLQTFSIPYYDIDRYLIEAVKCNSECVVNYILFNYVASHEGINNAFIEASKGRNKNILNNLILHGAEPDSIPI